MLNRTPWPARLSFALLICLFAKPLILFGRPFLVIALVMFILTFLFGNRLRQVATERETSRIPFLGGLLLVIFSLGLLEVLEPHYFFRADNKVMFFPVMTFAAQSFFQGVFPTWNPYQFLGEPLIGSSFFGLTYPLVYLAYAVAHYLLSNDQMFFCVFAWMHFIPGYFFMCHLLDREFGVTGWLMSLSAATFVLGGFGLICGRDWYYITPLLLWLPLVFLAYVRWVRRPTVMVGICLGAAAALMLHSGNVQMWFYWMVLLGVGPIIMALKAVMTVAHLRALAISLVTGVVVASPCLVPQLLFSAGAQYPGGSGEGILHRLNALFLPAPFVDVPHPLNWGTYAGRTWTPYFFVGYLSILAAMAKVSHYAISLWRRDNGPGTNPIETHLVWMFIIALGFSLGDGAVFWRAFQTIPVVDRFNRAYKLLSYLSFFVPLLGAIYIQSSLDTLRPKVRKIARGIVGAGLFLCLAVHVPQARANQDYFPSGEFPKRPQVLSGRIQDGDRIMSLSPSQPVSGRYFDTLPHNLATAYRIFSMEGDDILTAMHAESRIRKDWELWREYGVRWVLVSKVRKEEAQGLKAFLSYSDKDLEIYELPKPEPIVRILGDKHPIKEFKTWGDGITVRLERPLETSATLQLNFLWRRAMSAWVDGSEVEIEKDPLKRMRIVLAPGAQNIRLQYYPVFRFGYWLEAALFVLMIVLGLAMAQPRVGSIIWLGTPKHAQEYS